MEAAWKKAGRRASVVGQDKGNAVARGARLGLFSVPHDFSRRCRAARAVLHGMARTAWNRANGAAVSGRAWRVLSVADGMFAGVALLNFGGRFFQLRVTLTDSSASAGIYRLTAMPTHRGALVAACLPAVIARAGLAPGYLARGDCPAGAEPVAKVVGALPGDVVEVESGWAAVNGVRFVDSRTAARDSEGRPLAHVAWGVHRVIPGEVWLFGFNDARSWDARYFGPVPAASIRGVLRPVLTW